MTLRLSLQTALGYLTAFACGAALAAIILLNAGL